MSFYSGDYLCEWCGHISDLLVERAVKDELQDCEACGHEAITKLQPSVPALMGMNGTGAARDGYQRPGFKDLKEAAKLKVKEAGTPPSKRTEIRKEINKLEKI